MRRRSVALIVATLGALTSCGSGSDSDAAPSPETARTASSTPATFVVHGAIDIPGGCGSPAGDAYPDIRRGAQVAVLDAHSTPVALGTLDKGKDAPGLMGPCTFPFEVVNVPVGDSPIYSLAIGNRPPYRFTQDQAAALFLRLGD